jgi:hypothetical protein
MKVADLVTATEQALPGASERAALAVEHWRPKLVLTPGTADGRLLAYARQLERWAREDLFFLVETLSLVLRD